MKYAIPSFGSHNSRASLKLAVDPGGGFAMLAYSRPAKEKGPTYVNRCGGEVGINCPERELSRNSRWDELLSLRLPRGSLLPLI